MFKWISSIQNAIKDARVNRKGPGRRRNDKLKSGQDAIEASSKQKNTTLVDGGLTLTTERVTSILHCEQKNRPKGPKGRRLPGRTNLHSTILNGNSTSELFDRHSLTTSGSDHLFGLNSQSLSLECSTDMSTETSTNHNNFHHLRRPRAITNETLDNVDNGDNGDELKETKEGEDEDEESNEHKDKFKEEPVALRIIGHLNKKRMEEEENINQREKSLLISNGLDKGDNLSHENNHHHFNPSRLSNGGSNINNGHSPVSTVKSSTSPSPIKRFHDNNHFETKDLKRQLNAIFSNNNQHNQQQLTINLGDSIVTLDQVKLSACLKEIAPTLSTSNTLLNESSSLLSSMSSFNPQLKELIKELESLKDVKKTKNLNTKLQTVIGKLVTLSDDYSKSIESFDHYNNQVTKLISSLSKLVSQSKTTTTTTTTTTIAPTGPIVSPSSPSSLSPPSPPRLVNTNPIKLLNSNKTNLPTAHC